MNTGNERLIEAKVCTRANYGYVKLPRLKITRLGVPLAKRPTGFVSLQLFHQDLKDRARRIQLAKKRLKNMVSVSTQTDSKLVLLWSQRMVTTLHYLQPSLEEQSYNYIDKYFNRKTSKIVHIVLIALITLINICVIIGLYERTKHHLY
ncbi:PREDICTED: uncharacterized protein LOC108618658 [Drosophila arizonae]|uniref:Uncharacterized protein LOC108618658 n=1 Tax=Drosophila arizonae TaxID=7263 RepID=A0ABM1PSQ2_DROAR|nr:PREDICTED: uncharacterized protein LOC108618658 [Drosophila arizonae]